MASTRPFLFSSWVPCGESLSLLPELLLLCSCRLEKIRPPQSTSPERARLRVQLLSRVGSGAPLTRGQDLVPCPHPANKVSLGAGTAYSKGAFIGMKFPSSSSLTGKNLPSVTTAAFLEGFRRRGKADILTMCQNLSP